jgi:hypothetical protein
MVEVNDRVAEAQCNLAGRQRIGCPPLSNPSSPIRPSIAQFLQRK